VAAAEAAVVAGMAAANEYHEAAGRTPGVGVAVALPVPASGAATGLNFDLPPDVPAIRPSPPRSTDPMVVADPVVGGVAHVGPSGLLGRPPAMRTDPLMYVPLSSSPQTPRPSLGGRLRGAWRALWRR
jgi:hypothetical protein